MAKVKKTFRFTKEAAEKIEASENETLFVEKAVLQFNGPIYPKRPGIVIEI